MIFDYSECGCVMIGAGILRVDKVYYNPEDDFEIQCWLQR
jgi:hypothetical protein